MSDTILRQISMMELIPRFPAKTFTNEIKDKLTSGAIDQDVIKDKIKDKLKNKFKKLLK